MNEVILKVKKLNKDATLPKYGRDGDAAIDIYSCDSYLIPHRSKTIISTGIAVSFSGEYVLLLLGRSSMAARSIDVLGGVIDSNYRGEIKVVLFNNQDDEAFIAVGERIAQAILIPIPRIDVQEVKSLDETERGDRGFGSSGK